MIIKVALAPLKSPLGIQFGLWWHILTLPHEPVNITLPFSNLTIGVFLDRSKQKKTFVRARKIIPSVTYHWLGSLAPDSIVVAMSTCHMYVAPSPCYFLQGLSLALRSHHQAMPGLSLATLSLSLSLSPLYYHFYPSYQSYQYYQLFLFLLLFTDNFMF